MKTRKTFLPLLIAVFSIFAFQSCKSKDPSIAKVFVRSANNELLKEAVVILIADKGNNESDIEYVDTLASNSSGYVEFHVDEYYTQAGKSIKTANFDLICKKSGKIGYGSIRTRVNTTAVETVHTEN